MKQWRDPPSYNDAVRAVTGANKSELLGSLLVCRDFYFAGVAAFFGGNVFKFESVASLEQMSRRLDIDRRRHIASDMIERDTRGDRKELIAPGASSEMHDPFVLRAALEGLPALRQVVLDFKVGKAAPRFFWERLRLHTDGLRDRFEAGSCNVRFAVDGKVSDPETWIVK